MPGTGKISKSWSYVNASDNLTNETEVLTQEIDLQRFYTAEFIDDYRLLTLRESTVRPPTSLAVIDLREDDWCDPVMTLFNLPSCFTASRGPSLLCEWGVRGPTLAESLAPFYQDPTQRIIGVVGPGPDYTYLIFQLGALLKLLESLEGFEIEWDEWNFCVVIPSIEQERHTAWVSGSRLFCAGYGQDAQIEMFDFSLQGRGKYLSQRVNHTLGGIRYLSSTGARARVPDGEYLEVRGGHNSIAFCQVSVRVLCSLCKRN